MTSEIRAGLTSLSHEEVLDHVLLRGKRHREDALGPRSLRCFGALHRDFLEGALAKFRGARAARDAPETLALRGRLEWLAGDKAMARRNLERAVALDECCPEAWGFLGALQIETDLPSALTSLERASRLSAGWAWPHWWHAAALIETQREAESDRALDDIGRFAAMESAAEFPARLLGTLALFNLRRYRAAAEEAGRLVGLDPALGAGYGLRALARLAQEDWAGARRDYNDGMDRDPDSGFDLVDWLLNGRERSARETLEGLQAAIADHPGEACLYAVRAEVWRGPGFFRYDLALEDYRRAEALEPDRAWIQAHMARAEGQVLGLAAGLKRLDRAVELLPQAGWIRAWRGESKRLMGRYAEALEDLDEAVRRMPWYACAHAWRGAALAGLERWPAARRSLDTALRLEPTFPTDALAYHARGLARRSLGDVRGAIEDITLAFRLNAKYEYAGSASRPATASQCRAAIEELDGVVRDHPEDVWAFLWRGRASYLMGELKAASADFSRAIELDDANSWAYAWRALAAQAGGDAAAALRDFKRALRLEPKPWLAALQVAKAQASQGRLEEALGILEECERENLVNASFFVLQGDILLRLGRAEQSLGPLRKAIQLDRKFARAHELMARAHLRVGDPRSALREADAALSLQPGLATARLARGLARGRLGDRPGQMEDFRRAYRASPAIFDRAGAEVREALSS